MARTEVKGSDGHVERIDVDSVAHWPGGQKETLHVNPTSGMVEGRTTYNADGTTTECKRTGGNAVTGFFFKIDKK